MNDWATGTRKEAPYRRKGMFPEEYETKRDYFNAHLKEYYENRYTPLWKQNIISSRKYFVDEK